VVAPVRREFVFLFVQTQMNLKFLSLLVMLALAQSAETDETSSVALCRRGCASLHFRVVATCKKLCEGDDASIIPLCVPDKPANGAELEECVAAKRGLDEPLTPGEAATVVNSYIARVPVPGFIRTVAGYFVDTTAAAADYYTVKTQRMSDVVARAAGTASTQSCFLPAYPMFAVSIVHFDDGSWGLNPLAQKVLFSANARCVKDQIVYPSGEKVKAAGVALINGARCAWPVNHWPDGHQDMGMVVFVDHSCRPIGQGVYAIMVNKWICIYSATHVVKSASQMVFSRKGVTIVESVRDNEWVFHGDLAMGKECLRFPSPEAGDVCTLATYAGGMGLVSAKVAVQQQPGSRALFGSVEIPTPGGTSGAPCYILDTSPTSSGALAGVKLAIVSAVVVGGLELLGISDFAPAPPPGPPPGGPPPRPSKPPAPPPPDPP
jgi:hypothetical protein